MDVKALQEALGQVRGHLEEARFEGNTKAQKFEFLAGAVESLCFVVEQLVEAHAKADGGGK